MSDIASARKEREAKALLNEVTSYRRYLHQIPELDFDLPQTLAYVKKHLRALPCTYDTPCPSTAIAYFDLDKATGAIAGTHTTIAIRSDMDALPIKEASGVEFASTIEGHMHACGHDGHMAMALAAAKWVGSQIDAARMGRAYKLTHNVLFVFQPAEETTGGAKVVCESGVFERYNVTSIFGFHVWPDLPEGVVATRPGALLARSSETTLTIHGKASHIAKSAEGNDALMAAALFLTMAETKMATLAEKDPCLLKFGHMTSGSVRNAISGTSVIEGSLRVFSEDMFARAKTAIDESAARACAVYGCSYDLHFSEGYPPVINDEATTEKAYSVLAAAGITVDSIPEPLLIAEDFAYYQTVLPGTFFLLGTGTGIPLHADNFNFDEKILTKGVEVYKALLCSNG